MLRKAGKGPEARGAGHISVLKYRSLNFLYDPILRWTLREGTFKARLVAQARVEKEHEVLDLGCGPATLTLLTKKTYPEAEVVGLDADSDILRFARAKASKAHLNVALVQGLACDLPYPEKLCNHVVSSLLFRHLTRDDRVSAHCERLSACFG